VGIIREYPSRGITFHKLHVEATRNVIAAMQAAGVRRLIHMSALGSGPGAVTAYFRTKWEAESAVKDSGLLWTVMKPSVIFGPADEFVNMLAGQVRRLPLVPVLGDGRYQLQPVSVRDVAAGFVKALTLPAAIGRVYEIGGPERLSYNELLDHIARSLGRERAPKIHLPLPLMRPMIKLGERFPFFPLTTDQLAMLLMNNVCDPTAFFHDFSLVPLRFADGIREYLGPGGGRIRS
jgi:NADH dehydrogenase